MRQSCGGGKSAQGAGFSPSSASRTDALAADLAQMDARVRVAEKDLLDVQRSVIGVVLQQPAPAHFTHPGSTQYKQPATVASSLLLCQTRKLVVWHALLTLTLHCHA
jgi:hypothetical protein